MAANESSASRKDARAHWPIRRFRLGEEPEELEYATLPIEARLELAARLSAEMFELSGKSWPSYSRAEMPGVIVRTP